MSEKKSTVEVISPEAVVDVKVSTGYYKRVQDILFFILKDKTQDEIKAAQEAFKNEYNTRTDWVNAYETLVIFCREFEIKAKENNFVKTITTEELNSLSQPDDINQ